MRSKALLTMSSMGMVAFGFLCYMQGVNILTELNDITCFDTDNCFTTLWIDDLIALVVPAMISVQCFNLVLVGVAK
tara:strand:+ start:780 stop:1007 length:228 start_codon:yes stop_codon:yes gene_type:complete